MVNSGNYSSNVFRVADNTGVFPTPEEGLQYMAIKDHSSLFKLHMIPRYIKAQIDEMVGMWSH